MLLDRRELGGMLCFASIYAIYQSFWLGVAISGIAIAVLKLNIITERTKKLIRK